ncbi:hypothetical protein ACHAXS_014487 [Conticribra weissflogii]
MKSRPPPTPRLPIISTAVLLSSSCGVSSFSQSQSIFNEARKTSAFLINEKISRCPDSNHLHSIQSPCIPTVHAFPTALRSSNADEPDVTSSSHRDDIHDFHDPSSTPADTPPTTETSFAQSLSERISQIQLSESDFVSGLQRRVTRVAQAEERDAAMSYGHAADDAAATSDDDIVVSLPVITFDALLPRQRLSGSTTDPTFGDFLRSLGLGGSFVMTSVNTRQRKIRRFGVVAKIELVDAEGDDGDGEGNADGRSEGWLSSPTAVTFSVVGTRRCEILGPTKGMQSRIGRWRRGYDPDGEESRLGWGDERFVDRAEESTWQPPKVGGSDDISEGFTRETADSTEWTDNDVLIIDEFSEDVDATTAAMGNATHTVLPLISQWLSLASDPRTYDNTDVVASTRRRAGEPGLVVHPTALLKKVQEELGPMPPPERPTALAVWGAGLLNPLPALGVAPEVRGAVLEANGAEAKLKVLERGLLRSIENLDGSRPLGM